MTTVSSAGSDDRQELVAEPALAPNLYVPRIKGQRQTFGNDFWVRRSPTKYWDSQKPVAGSAN
jgi:hypothetical protein